MEEKEKEFTEEQAAEEQPETPVEEETKEAAKA